MVIDSGSPTTGAFTITATTLNIEDLAFSLATTTSISNTTSSTTASTLELNGGRGTTVPLLDVNSSKTLTIKNGSTGALNVQLDTSGTFEIDSSGGLTISSNITQLSAGKALTITGTGSGVVTLSGTNTFSGGLVAAGAEVDVTTADANLGAAGGSITINGGRLGFGTTSFTVDSTRAAYLGANPTGGNNTGTLSIKGSITTTFNQGFQNLTGAVGDLVKQGGGTLALGGASSYSGTTFLNNGAIQLTTADNRLPTGTTLFLGQSNSANAGTLNLNGFNQQVAGLSTTNAGTGAPTTKNTVTNSTTTAVTLTLGGSGTYTYGDGSATNSGVITGALSINKTGTGAQTFGDANTYTGSTTVSAGTLITGTATTGSAVQALGGTSGVLINNGGTLQMGAANQFNATNPAPLKLSGTTGSGNAATLSINGNSQGSTTANGVGALTLAAGSASNVIDFGQKAGVATFASLIPNGAVLNVNNYVGNGTPGGTDQLIFNADQNSPSNMQLGNFDFGSGPGVNVGEQQVGTSSFYEIYSLVAVPEPATLLGGLLLVGAFGWRQRRRIGGWALASRRPWATGLAS